MMKLTKEQMAKERAKLVRGTKQYPELVINDIWIDESEEPVPGTNIRYKDAIDVRRIDYDLEILPYNFTFASVDLKSKGIIVLYMNERPINDMDDIRKQINEVYEDYTIAFLDGKDPRNWVEICRRFSNHYRQIDGRTYEWRGWNSKNYDLLILSVIIAHLETKGQPLDTMNIRDLSDIIIEKGMSSPYKFFQELRETKFRTQPSLVQYAQKIYYDSLTSLRHIDTGALNEKGKDNSAAKKFMFPLKTISSYLAMDVLDDDVTRIDFSVDDFAQHWETFDHQLKRKIRNDGSLTDEGLFDMITYNIRDIINTGHIYEEPEYVGSLEAKDTLRKLYPFLNKNMQGDRRRDSDILPRDATASQFAGKIIRGPNQAKLHDAKAIDLTWTFKDGHTENLLDFVEREEYVHPLFVEFYRHWEGRDVSTFWDANKAMKASPTGKTMMHIPYMDADGRATSAYATPSIGGAHGTLYDASKYNDIYDIDMLDPTKRPTLVEFSRTGSITCATVDVKDVIHADFSSYYPTMSIALNVYDTGGVDYYSQTLEQRFELKAMRPNKPRSEWTEDEIQTDNNQESLKLVINGGTGAANQRSKYVDLPLDNKITSMRIIGNILIYTLGQRFAKEGALIVSTNTDGLYAVNITQERAQEIVDDFISIYGLMLEPEPMERLINKDVNNRIEFDSGEINSVGGPLSNCMDKIPSPSLGGRRRMQLEKSPNFPLVTGKVALRYMAEVDGWLDEPTPDAAIVRDMYDDFLYEEPFRPDIWASTLKGNRDRVHYYKPVGETEEIRLQDTNRVIFSLDTIGGEIRQSYKGKDHKIAGYTSNQVKIVNARKDLFDIRPEEIDVQAYVEWTIGTIENWQTSDRSVPEINQGPPVAQQISLFD